MRPTKLYLIGAGRHPATRQLRRANRFSRRVNRVGELTISHRRVDVDLEFVRKHLKDIVAYMRKGTLIVAHSSDKFVDEAELLAMLDVDPVEPSIEDSEDSAEDMELSDEEKAKILTEMDELSDEEKKEISDFGGYVPSVSELEESAEVPPEVFPEASTPTDGAEAPKEAPVTSKDLPDLSTLTKKQLIVLCEERGIEVKGSPNNATLHDLLNAWKNS